MTMRVAILSYPMLFQRQGGLQIQILETIVALNSLGIQADLINPNQEKLTNYDVVHVFSAINSNFLLAEAAKGAAKPVVLSPLIQPDWTWFTGMRDRFLDRLVGKLSEWHVRSTYRDIETCLQLSDFIVALGDREKRSISDAFKINPKKITVIPNGVPPRFFAATPDLFIEKTGLGTGFILCVAAINRHKNQLTLVKALQRSPYKIVLIGSCLETDKEYLAQVLAYPNVVYLGSLNYNDPLLPSAYAAAGVFCLPSHSEVMPLCVLEALAADTPVVMTCNHCMALDELGAVVQEIVPDDPIAIENAITRFLAEVIVGRNICRQHVLKFSWQKVAEELSIIYHKVLDLDSRT